MKFNDSHVMSLLAHKTIEQFIECNPVGENPLAEGIKAIFAKFLIETHCKIAERSNNGEELTMNNMLDIQIEELKNCIYSLQFVKKPETTTVQ